MSCPYTSARQQFRAAFRQMAVTGLPYSLYRSRLDPDRVVLDVSGSADYGAVLVPDVHARTEEQTVNALRVALSH